MEPKNVYSIFFSPTGTSRTITRAVSQGMGGEAETLLDITLLTPKASSFSKKDVVVVGVPVYGGRLPQTAVKRLQALKGNETPIVAIVVYGNRAYEDALAELCDLCIAQGFKLLSGGAFVGQHSFSSKKLPIAHDRPDQQDLDAAVQLGVHAREQLKTQTFLNPEIIPRNRPYKSVTPSLKTATATTSETCSHCGACATSCPVQCIEMVDGMPQTWQDGCLWCMACLQHCPTGARKIILPNIYESAKRLHTNCQHRKESETFLPKEKK